MGEDFRLSLKFWGVRGSTPTPQIQNLAYGGNTSCLEVRPQPDEVFVFDAGTGLRNLGLALEEEFKGEDLTIRVFLTHFHWDHIQGIPFFAPLYEAGSRVIFHSFAQTRGVEEMLQGQMQNPYFPVELQFLPARKEFVDIDRQPLRFGEMTIRPFPLNHPQGAYGYRIERKGATIVYATDLEHGDPKLDSLLREYSEQADILIYDAQYAPEEYHQHKGWGHSTWLEATKVARDSRVENLFLFHHDPSHDDQTFASLVDKAGVHFENTQGAKEGSFFIL